MLQEMPPCNRQEHIYILREEVEAAVRSLKKRKSPGEDNITAEMMQAGEESSVEMMYTLCKRIYQEKSGMAALLRHINCRNYYYYNR